MRACFVNASGQNVFFQELLDAIRTAVENAGVETETAVDHFPPLDDDLVYVLVPHEYIPLTLPRVHPTPTQLRRTVVIATEQPGTQWFEETAAIADSAGATLDINALGMEELDRRGVAVRPLKLGYVPEWDYWHRRDDPRPIDATFMGGYTPRRAAAVASCGFVLSAHTSSLHLVEGWQPHTAHDPRFLSGEEKFRVLASSRVMFNAHRQESAYLEWARLLEAAANGCVFLTEHSSGFGPLVPGEHFVSVEVRNLPVALQALLEDDDRIRRLRDATYDFLRSELRLSDGVYALVDALSDVALQPVDSDAASPSPGPAPKPAPLPVPAYTEALGQPSENTLLRMAVKKVMLQQRRLERRLATPEHDEPNVTLTTHGPYEAVAPKVTVVLTVFNYAHVVEEAIDSVALSKSRSLELVVVDDASTDEAVETVREALETRPWLAAKVLSLSRNGGLPAARNLGVEEARAEYVFILDADNLVYPHGIERLALALDGDADAAFAYGIIEKFDSTGSTDLMSWLPWDPNRFRYGNYIDAMALVRRDAIARAGGFTTDDRLFGWEDFALWCAFAQLGMRGVHVPQIVARYRSNPSSMISLTNIDTTEAWAVLVERFPFLALGATGE